MENSRKARERAENALAGPPEQPAKGSAIGMIAAESVAVQEKTARLKKLRLERDAAEAKSASKTKTGAKTTTSKAKVASKAKASAKPKKVSKAASGSKGAKAPAAA